MRLASVSIVSLFFGAAILSTAQEYVISTYAGGGSLPLQVPGVDLSIDWYSKGLAVDADGNVYFTSLNCVFKLDRGGMVTRIAGNGRSGYSGDGGVATAARFSVGQITDSPPYVGSLPPGLAVDQQGNVYVADNGNSRIRKISLDGIVTTMAGNGTFGFSGDDGPALSAQLSSVLGLIVDHAGNLLLSDSDNHRVRRIAPDGTITTLAGNGACGFSGDGGRAATAQLCNPAGMAMDSAGSLFIAEAGASRIRRISPEGIIATAVTGVGEPTNVSVDESGDLFVVADDGNFWESWQAVWKVSRSGVITLFAGGACEPQSVYCPPSPSDGTTAATTFLSDRLATAIDGDGNLLVASPANRRVYGVLPNGNIAVIAGNGEYDFSGDGGPAVGARLASPASLALDGAGNLFISDVFNSVIRKVLPGGIITTYAGNGTWGASGDGGPATSASLSPNVIAADGAGNLFIANDQGGIRKVSPGGIIITAVGAPAYLAALASDAAGDLFLAAHDGIRKVFAGESTSTEVSPAHVSAIAVDIVGNVFFAEMGRIRRLGADGNTITVAGNGTLGFSSDGGPATDAQVGNVFGLALDGAGNLFIADRDNNRIRRVSTDGTIATIAGNGANDYSGDGGPATAASISRPSIIAVDHAGNVYFTDVDHNVVRILRPTPGNRRR